MFVEIQCALCGKTFDHDCSSLSPTAECPHCGKSNSVAPPAAPKETPAAPSTPSSGGTRSCPACQAEIEQDAVLCIHCGYNLATRQKIGGKSGFAANPKIVALASAGLAVLALGAAYLLWPESDAQPPFDPSAIAAAAKSATPSPAVAAPTPVQPEPPAAARAAPAETNVPAGPVAPPTPTPEELAAQKAGTERAAFEEKRFEAEQNLRIQMDTREPLYIQNETIELRRKNGILDKGTLTGFAGTGTSRVALVATALGEVGVPFDALDVASRRRVDPEFREAFIQHLLNTKLPAPGEAAP